MAEPVMAGGNSRRIPTGRLRAASMFAAAFGLTALLASASWAQNEAPVMASAAIDGAEQAGIVSVADGNVTAIDSDGTSRVLQDGSPFYVGDTITTAPDSHASLDFEDQGSVVLRPSTAFQIASYHFEPDRHPETAGGALPPPAAGTPAESAFFSLIKGGFRAVSGLIGHVNRQDYGIATPTATIGIRGTQFDVRYCRQDCADSENGGAASEDGLYTSVLNGAVAMRNDTGETLLPQGQHIHAVSRSLPFQRLARPPAALRHMELPSNLQRRDQHMRQQIHQQRQQRRQQHEPPPRHPLRKPLHTGRPGPNGEAGNNRRDVLSPEESRAHPAARDRNERGESQQQERQHEKPASKKSCTPEQKKKKEDGCK